ncbi:MAG: DUF5752 family protein [Desulfobacteraceae bacterium]|nr:DUF5752 family protein [Desulfobacteraceae bacterium]
MAQILDRVAENPFQFYECFMMAMPLGKKVANLKELLGGLHEIDEAVLFYHLIQSRLTLDHPAVEYPNDFALWAANALQNSELAEKLSSFDPFECRNLGLVRQAVVDVLEEYLWDLPSVPWARPGFEFHFCQASLVVMDSLMSAHTLKEFCGALTQVGLDSIYYHFFEARWRLGELKSDDFSFWIESNFELPELVKAIRDLDVYFYSLKELRENLLGLIHQHLGELCENPG